MLKMVEIVFSYDIIQKGFKKVTKYLQNNSNMTNN